MLPEALTGPAVGVTPLRILVVDDDPADLELCLQRLKRSEIPFDAEVASSQEEFVSKLKSTGETIDVILTDYRMKGWTGIDALAYVKRNCPDIPVILLSGTLGDELAVDCIKRGITDYILKDQMARLPTAVRRAQEERALRQAEHRALLALRESEEHYRSMVQNATYGICRLTAEGTFLEVNPSLARMLGFESVEELLREGTTHSFYCDVSTRDTLRRELLEMGRCDQTVDWRRKDGKIITVRISGRLARSSPRENGDLRDSAEVIVEDITERLALEKQLVQSQKFEAIGQLAGGIAHDFNNMIGAILGWADLGLDECGADSPLRRYFEKVRHQANRAAALTRQLLTFARRQLFEPRPIDINQTAVETVSLLEKVIGSNIEIRATLAPDLAVVRADPVQMEQVLMNLCINARDAMPKGGVLNIETLNATLDERFCTSQPLAHPGAYVVLRVIDGGSGMVAPTMDRIFEPFFTTKEVGKGTGLGLATVWGIVRQHSGFLQVESQLGKGSTFSIYFPADAGAPAPAERSQLAAPARGGSETILVAEDHDGLRQMALETLHNLGYRTIAACDGEEATALFSENRQVIDLALLDVMLPKVTGPEVYARLHRERPDLPVIFATGYSPDLELLQSVMERGLPVLQKPYSPRDLGRKVWETLDQQRRLAGL
jgi:two-component system, cell cycle sensor histidine kinase and response regulator CckA